MSNQPKYPPIKAPTTPERKAAIKFIQDCEKAERKRVEEANSLKHIQTNRIDKATQLRDKFEEWILNQFYCPQGLGQLQKDHSGKYTKVAYNKRDSTKFSEVESLWQAYLTGHCHLS